MPSSNPTARARSSERSGGFTLLELVLAVAIIGGSFLTLLSLKLDSIDRADGYNTRRMIQRFTQEQLDEVAFGILEETFGTFEERGRPDWTWEIQAVEVSTTEPILLECTITTTYPSGPDGTEEYQLSTWFFPDEENHLLAGLSSGGEELPR